MSAATQRQRAKIHATLADLGIHDRDEKLRVLSALIYRRVTSTNDLSFDDAHVCIDTLTALDREQLPKVVEAGERWLAGRAS